MKIKKYYLVYLRWAATNYNSKVIMLKTIKNSCRYGYALVRAVSVGRVLVYIQVASLRSPKQAHAQTEKRRAQLETIDAR